MKLRKNSNGFGAVGAILILVVVIVIGVAGYMVFKNHNKTTTVSVAKTVTSTPADPYAGWKTYCDATVKACFKYPSDWAPDQYNTGLENSAQTEYVSLGGATNKDQAADDAYIVSITDLNPQNADLKIVGTVVDNQPGYAVYDASYVTTNNLQAGTTQNIVYGNYTFNGKTGAASLDGTPDVNGYAAIKTTDQAKAWFNTAEAKQVLLVMQSFYYQ